MGINNCISMVLTIIYLVLIWLIMIMAKSPNMSMVLNYVG